MKKNKAMAQDINFVVKDIQGIMEKYNEQQVFYKKAVLKRFALFTGKYLYWIFFFNKISGLPACNFIKK